MTRCVTTHRKRTKDNEYLTIVTCFEEEVSKQEVKKMNPYSKTYQTLIFNKHTRAYEYKKA